MRTVKKYKKEAMKFFYLSVKTDLDKWSTDHNDLYDYLYCSPKYSDTLFKIYKNTKLVVTIERKGTYTLSRWYNLKYIFYFLKVQKHFNRIQQDKKDQVDINLLKVVVDNVSPHFLKQIRKEKLDKLS